MHTIDSLDSLRARLEILERQTHARDRQLRWWRGLAGLLAVLTLVSLPLPLGIAQNTLEGRLAALEDKLAPVTRVDTDLFITGVNLHIRNGQQETHTANGLGNLIVGYNEPRSRGTNTRTGSHHVVIGMRHNFAAYGGLVVGLANEINGPWAAVSGGTENTAYGAHASVSGGTGNIASNGASVSGGLNNTANGAHASVSGGIDNGAIGDFASVCGGRANLAVGAESSVSGGVYNTALGISASVSGGVRNQAKGANASVSGGAENRAEGANSSVSGGINNAVSSQHASVGEGRRRNLMRGAHAEPLPVQPHEALMQRGRDLGQGLRHPGDDPVLLALQRGIALQEHGSSADHLRPSPQSLGEGE
jgi:hypothetical protein